MIISHKNPKRVWLWFEEKWGVGFYLFIFTLIISIVILLYLTKAIPPALFYSLIGSIIVIGTPTINHLYRERLKKPNIVFGDELEFTVAPLQARLSEKAKTVKPTVYYRLEVENKGRVAAKNCMVSVDIQEDGSHLARWAIPENSEKYDLLPGETRNIHIFRATILPQYINIVFNNETREFVNHGEGSEVGIEPEIPKPLEAISWDTIDPLVQRPRKISPESKGESSFGGWLGQEIDYDACTVKVQAIAEDYKSEKRDGFDTLKLTEKTVSIAATEGNWQNQWGNGDKDGFFDRADELKRRTMEVCQKRLDKLSKYPL